MGEQRQPRTFKSAWFAKAARKAIAQVMAGQADDLGGGVFKKRLADNRLRSIILARGGDFWVYQYLFAKQDRANISEAELRGFRTLAKQFATMTANDIDNQIADGHWIEICRTP